jgi:hypothetical protein
VASGNTDSDFVLFFFTARLQLTTFNQTESYRARLSLPIPRISAALVLSSSGCLDPAKTTLFNGLEVGDKARRQKAA